MKPEGILGAASSPILSFAFFLHRHITAAGAVLYRVKAQAKSPDRQLVEAFLSAWLIKPDN